MNRIVGLTVELFDFGDKQDMLAHSIQQTI